MKQSRKRMDAARAHKIRQHLNDTQNPALADVIERNIGIIELLRREAEDARGFQDRFADWITAWSGSMGFLFIHLAWFGGWIVCNMGLVPGVKPFDPYPFGLLTMVVSLEAIFLATLVLISQNRQAQQSDQREGLDLQIDLLAEYEITRMLRLVDKMAEKMGIEDAFDEEIDQLCLPVAPNVILKEIENRHGQRGTTLAGVGTGEA